MRLTTTALERPAAMHARPQTLGADEAAAQLASWIAAEAAQRTLSAQGAGVGLTPPAQMLGMDGLAYFQAVLRGELPTSHIGHTLDFLLVDVARGHAVFQGRPGLAHLNPLGSVHGGWFATLLDSALGCAVHSALPQGKAYTTLELKVNLVRALSPEVARVRADGRVIHVGSQTATAEARLLGPDGKLYAHGSTTCLVFDARRPAAA
jgi:uncharacterized protein (TIGR00369 family)